MQETILSQDISNADLSKIAALQQKRTLAFVNHFVITTVQFLNTFSKNCEQKLMQFERKLEKINATMVLLEAKLSSIPELNTQADESKLQEINQEQQKESNTSVEPTQVVPDPAIGNVDSAASDPTPHKPEYERFVKMVQVGVPVEAVKLKISLEGLDPNEFDKIVKK